MRGRAVVDARPAKLRGGIGLQHERRRPCTLGESPHRRVRRSPPVGVGVVTAFAGHQEIEVIAWSAPRVAQQLDARALKRVFLKSAHRNVGPPTWEGLVVRSCKIGRDGAARGTRIDRHRNLGALGRRRGHARRDPFAGSPAARAGAHVRAAGTRRAPGVGAAAAAQTHLLRCPKYRWSQRRWCPPSSCYLTSRYRCRWLPVDPVLGSLDVVLPVVLPLVAPLPVLAPVLAAVLAPSGLTGDPLEPWQDASIRVAK